MCEMESYKRGYTHPQVRLLLESKVKYTSYRLFKKAKRFAKHTCDIVLAIAFIVIACARSKVITTPTP